nr:MAG TPA: repressor [Caudoviricetes sp.]
MLDKDYIKADSAVRRAFHDSRTRILSVRLPVDVYEDLRSLGSITGKSMGSLVGYAVDRMLDETGE